MKKFLSLLLAVFAVGLMLPVQAQSPMGAKMVPAALENADYVGKARPKDDATVYFIYMSRQACSICVAELPAINKTYRRMKGKGAEIVMINIDQNVEIAEKWMKKDKIKFPMIAPGKRHGIPFPFDYAGGGLLPHAVAVTADGEKLGQANGSEVADFFAKNWRKYVAQVRKDERKKAKEAAEED